MGSVVKCFVIPRNSILEQTAKELSAGAGWHAVIRGLKVYARPEHERVDIENARLCFNRELPSLGPQHETRSPIGQRFLFPGIIPINLLFMHT